MNLKKLNLAELNTQEMKKTEGGLVPWAIPAIIAGGAALAWAFEKGEEFGKSLAKNH